MKKKLILLLLPLLFSLPVCADSAGERTVVEPRASTVFNSTGSAISRTAYGGDCTLLGDGKGSVQINLQKQNSYNKFWYVYDGQTSTKTFTNTSVCAHSKNYILPEGKFRCKTVATATRNGVTETRTVYSPELTVYSN